MKGLAPISKEMLEEVDRHCQIKNKIGADSRDSQLDEIWKIIREQEREILWSNIINNAKNRGSHKDYEEDPYSLIFLGLPLLIVGSLWLGWLFFLLSLIF